MKTINNVNKIYKISLRQGSWSESNKVGIVMKWFKAQIRYFETLKKLGSIFYVALKGLPNVTQCHLFALCGSKYES